MTLRQVLQRWKIDYMINLPYWAQFSSQILTLRKHRFLENTSCPLTNQRILLNSDLYRELSALASCFLSYIITLLDFFPISLQYSILQVLYFEYSIVNYYINSLLIIPPLIPLIFILPTYLFNYNLRSSLIIQYWLDQIARKINSTSLNTSLNTII